MDFLWRTLHSKDGARQALLSFCFEAEFLDLDVRSVTGKIIPTEKIFHLRLFRLVGVI